MYYIGYIFVVFIVCLPNTVLTLCWVHTVLISAGFHPVRLLPKG